MPNRVRRNILCNSYKERFAKRKNKYKLRLQIILNLFRTKYMINIMEYKIDRIGESKRSMTIQSANLKVDTAEHSR